MSLNTEIIRDQLNRTIERLKALGADDAEIAASMAIGAVIAARKGKDADAPKLLSIILTVVAETWEATRP